MNVYQTWKSSEDIPKYHESWKYEYEVIMTYDDEINKDIYEYCELQKSYEICNYIKNVSFIQKLDIWRYIKIFINGGIYSDIDIGLRNSKMFNNSQNYSMIVCRESPTFIDEPFKFIKHTARYILGFTDRPRFYQFRQSIFYAKKDSIVLYKLIQKITFNLKNIEKYKTIFKEPQLTFEMTGPAIFTDVIRESSENDVLIVDYDECLLNIDYHSYGTWREKKEGREFLKRCIIQICFYFYLIFELFYLRLQC